jgi:hypothetical protein
MEMKTAIKARVQTLISNYKKVTDVFLAEIKKWETDSLYSSDVRQDKIREVKAQMRVNDNDFNKQLVKIIGEEKETIVNSKINKPADYQGQITNALEFIKMSGNAITDELAFDMVKPFQGDFQTMKLFEVVIRNHANGKCNVTLSRLRKFEFLKTKLIEIETFAKGFFDTSYCVVGSLGYIFKEDGLLQAVDEVQSIVEFLNSETAAIFKEAEKEVQDEVLNEMVV